MHIHVYTYVEFWGWIWYGYTAMVYAFRPEFQWKVCMICLWIVNLFSQRKPWGFPWCHIETCSLYETPPKAKPEKTMVPKRKLLFQEIIVQVPAASFRMCKRTLSSSCFYKWVFPKIGVPQNGWFINGKSLLKMDDYLGTPIFGNIQIPKSKMTSTYAAATFTPPSSMFSILENRPLHRSSIHWETNGSHSWERDWMRSRLWNLLAN